MKPLLVLRPEPGASATAAKAADLNLDVVVISLFEVRPRDWEPVAVSRYDAVFLTSANALKYAGNDMSALLDLPAFCVGTATAQAATTAGFSNIVAGTSDAQNLAEMAAANGHRHVIWLAGTPSIPITHPDVRIDVRTVYETIEKRLDADTLRTFRHPGVALLHSPRAAQCFASLMEDRGKTDIVAISQKAAIAAGPGWASVQWPEAPSDAAMLTLAAPLCRAG